MKSSLFASKKAQWVEFAFIIVLVLVLAFVYVALQLVTEDVNTMVQADDSMSVEAKASLAGTTGSLGSVNDSGLAIILVGAWLLCLGLAYNSGGSPLLLVVSLFIVVALALVGMILSNAWGEFSTDPGLSGVIDSLPITNFILSNFLPFVLVIGFSVVWVGVSRGGGF